MTTLHTSQKNGGEKFLKTSSLTPFMEGMVIMEIYLIIIAYVRKYLHTHAYI